MNFAIEPRKLTQVACRFTQKEGGAINVLKLVKLVYLADRRSLAERNRPIAGGSYFSLPYGPVTSEVLDAAKGKARADLNSEWQTYFEPKREDEHDVSLKAAPAPPDQLAESELDIIDDIYDEIGNEDRFRIANWCHEHCSEWTRLETGRKPITGEEILKALNKPDSEIEQVIGQEAEIESLRKLLG